MTVSPISAAVGRLAAVVLVSALALAARGREAAPAIDLEAALGKVEASIGERLQGVHQTLAAALADPTAGDARIAAAYAELGRAGFAYELEALAEASFQHAARRDPDDGRWPYLLGVLYQNQRRLEAAAEAFERSLALRPDDPPATVRLGQVLLLAGDTARARSLFEQAAGETLWVAPARYGLGRIAVQAGDWAAAISHFEAARAQQPQAIEIQQQLGLAYRGAGNLERARALLGERPPGHLKVADPLLADLGETYPQSDLLAGFEAFSAGRVDQAVAYYRKAIARDPEQPVHHRALGEALLERGDLEDAREALEQALALEGDNAAIHLRLATTLVQIAGQLTGEARAHFDQALRLLPGYRDAHLELAKALASSERFRDADEHFAAAVAAAPDDVAARLLWARCLLRLDDPTRAAAEIRAVLAVTPDDPAARLLNANALGKAGDRAAARAELEAVLALDPEPALAAQAEAQLGTLAARAGDLDAAAERFRRAVAADAESHPGHLGLATAYSRLGRHREAADHYLRVLEIERRHGAHPEGGPDLKTLLFNLGTALGHAGDLDAAAERFGQVVELDPLDAAAHDGLATALLLAGRDAQARDALEAAHERLPDAVALTEKLARLLATSREPSVRDGVRALALARAAFAAGPTPHRAEIMAAAFAAAGRLAEAVTWLERLIAEAERAAAPLSETARLRRVLERYRQGLDS